MRDTVRKQQDRMQLKVWTRKMMMKFSWREANCTPLIVKVCTTAL